MGNKNRNKVIPQMFDVRPVNKDGDLDLEKIKKIKKVLKLKNNLEKNVPVQAKKLIQYFGC